MKEKLGKTVVDGKIIDLDTASLEELENSYEKIKKQEEDIQNRVYRMLGLKEKKKKVEEKVEEDER